LTTNFLDVYNKCISLRLWTYSKEKKCTEKKNAAVNTTADIMVNSTRRELKVIVEIAGAAGTFMKCTEANTTILAALAGAIITRG
jgi:hypothetical protein